MVWVPDEYLDLLKDETKAFGNLATLMKDGSPQVTVIWFNTDGNYILINSTTERVKDHNMRRDARVTILIVDPKNPYRYIQIRGRVVEITTGGARQHIDALAKKYRGVDKYIGRSENEVRVSYKILPEKISVF
jgi:PPOX class probable F420-dependent enzyme